MADVQDGLRRLNAAGPDWVGVYQDFIERYPDQTAVFSRAVVQQTPKRSSEVLRVVLEQPAARAALTLPKTLVAPLQQAAEMNDGSLRA
jgi:hypothetical protein